MLEVLLSTGKAATAVSGIDDGLPTLIKGDVTAGYYGATASNKPVINGDDLAAAIGLTAGTSVNSTAGWLKFAYNGKVLYIAKMPLRDSVAWQDLYQAGAVYGDDTNGKYPSGTARTQNARVTINGVVCRVRLMHLSDTDTSATGVAASGEYSRLWANIRLSNSTWAAFTDAQLGHITNNYVQGIESSNATANVLETAVNNLLQADSKTQHNTGSFHYLWRPVLEVI